jgi:hypothetical protein
MHSDLGGDRGRYGSLGEEYRRFGTKGALAPSAAVYAPAVPTAADPGGTGAGAGLAAGDTTHHVEVRFMDAPPGMRSGLTRAEGPAETSIRVQYAMPHI